MKEIVCSGALIYSKKAKRFLFLHRTKGKNKNFWGLVGGINEKEETPWSGLQREIVEEIGPIDICKSIPLETFVSNDNHFHFYTYLCLVEDEFIPKLNSEHKGYAWSKLDSWPKPLHPGVFTTLQIDEIAKKIATVESLMCNST